MSLELILVFILGLVIGSFLNCVLYRSNQKESFLKGRSYCPNCQHTLEWYDLIPLLSFLFLGGRCRYCHKKISWQYPVVEAITGLVFVFIYNYFKINLLEQGFSYNFYQVIFYWLIASIFVLIFVYDLKYYLILDKFIIAGIVCVLVWQGLNYSLGLLSFKEWLTYFYSGLGAALFFFCFWFFSRGQAMGFGDVKLAFFLGLLLGFPNILLAIFIGSVLGAIIGLILVGTKKKKIKSAVPFGPFLVVGSFATIFYGSEIFNWYLSLSLIK